MASSAILAVLRSHSEDIQNHTDSDDFVTLETFDVLWDSERFHHMVETIFSMTPEDCVQLLLASGNTTLRTHPMFFRFPA